jgi:hypothetical protein
MQLASWPLSRTDPTSPAAQLGVREMVHTRHRPSTPLRLLTALLAAVVLIAACGAPHARLVRGGDVAAAVRGFPTFPVAVWEGDVTAQETDGQLIWIVSWTAPSEEATVSRFFASILGRSGWRFAPGHTSHELALRRNEPELRGYLRYRKADFREAGTSVTLGVRGPRARKRLPQCTAVAAPLPGVRGPRLRPRSSPPVGRAGLGSRACWNFDTRGVGVRQRG